MDQDGKSIYKHIKVTWAILVFLAFLNLVNLALYFIDPKSSFYPSVVVKEGPKGKDGTSAEVDYKAVSLMVQKQVDEAISALPKPKDGSKGQDGQSVQGPKGDNGVDATVDYDKVRTIVGEEIFKLPPNTVEVVPREPQFQVNPKSGNVEIRYEGDDSWQVLLRSDALWQVFLQKCQENNMCPSL